MTAGPSRGSQRPPPAWAPWAAAVWAAGFAAGSLYLAAGGTGGLGLVAAAIEDRIRARDPAMVAALRVTGGLKLAAAALALSTLRAWSGWRRRGLLVLVGSAGVLFELWGGADVVRGALVASHTLQAPAGWGTAGPCGCSSAASTTPAPNGTSPWCAPQRWCCGATPTGSTGPGRPASSPGAS